MAQQAQQFPQQEPWQPGPEPSPQQPYNGGQHYEQSPQYQGQPYQNPPVAPPQYQQQYRQYPPAQQPPQYQVPQQYAGPAQQQYPQAYAPPQQYPPQNHYPPAPQQQYPPQNQYPPQQPPVNAPKVRDAFVNGAKPYLQPGEQVYYGFMLKLDDTIEETPREFQIEIEGQHHALGDLHRASSKLNKGIKWAANPLDAFNERLAEKTTDALNRHLAGPVFVGGWQSQAGLLIRYIRATSEDYGPGAYGAVTNQRYMVFRGARLGGSGMRLVYAVPRAAIAGVRLEGTKDAMLHGRSPRAELHFTDRSMVATMMPTKQGEQLHTALQMPVQPQMPQQQQQYQQPMQHG